MADDKSPSQWSTTAASNTTVDTVSIAENCAMSNLNNAMRAIMAGVTGALTFISTSGTDTYTATMAPAIDAYTTGFFYAVNFANANTSTTPTLNLNSIGAKTITRVNGNAVNPGDLHGPHLLEYDGTNLRVLNPVLVSGGVAQIVSTETGAVATGTTILPIDDTIPQNTEGDQFMSLAITPKNASSTLVIEVVWNGTTTGTDTSVTCALFQDTTANALAASWGESTGGSDSVNISFRHMMTAGTTSATTFKVRAGCSGSQTTTFNGQNSSRTYGGVMASSIVITEYLP